MKQFEKQMLPVVFWAGLLSSVALAVLVGYAGDGHEPQTNTQPSYLNPHLSTGERVNDLLSRMSREEKIGQLLTVEGWQLYSKTGGKAALNELAEDRILRQKAGSIYGVFRADPWTQITLSTGLQPVQSFGAREK